MDGDVIGDGANKTVVFLGLPMLTALWWLRLIRLPVKENDGLWDEEPVLASVEAMPVLGVKAPFKRPRINALKSSLSPLFEWSTTQLSSV